MVIGLTGNIGSGKSMVAKLFEILGCLVLSSDFIAKQQYFKPNIKKQIIALLGSEAYLDDQTINKNFISQKIFKDKNLRNQINQIIHPEVIKEFAAFAKLHPDKIIIKESALLFEAGLKNEVDKIILVVSNDALRLKRVMQRDKSTREHVLNQMEAQISQEEKMPESDFIIYNNEDLFLIEQVLSVMKALQVS